MSRQWRRLVAVKTPAAPGALSRVPSLAAAAEYAFQPAGPAVKRAIRAGIPSHLRPMAWFHYSGGEALRAAHASPAAFYEALLLQPKPTAFFLLTDRMKMDFRDVLPTNQLVRRDYFSASNTMINDVPDVGRVRIIPDRTESPESPESPRPRRMTLAEDPLVGHAVAPATPFMSRLYNVLVAFFMFRPTVEYCRGLCTIAAVLLLVIQDEERTFWTLSALFVEAEGRRTASSTTVETVVFHDYRADESPSSSPTSDESTSTVVSDAASNVTRETGFKHFPPSMFKDTSTCGYAGRDGFAAILERKRPHLVAQLKRLDIPIALLATNWFQSLFVDVLPTEASMRVLDAFIGEGFKILYRVALALFVLNEDELLARMRQRVKGDGSGGLLSSRMGPSPPLGEDASATGPSSSQVVLNLIKFMPKKQVDADVLLDCAFNRVGSLSMATILAECRAAAEQEKPLQSIRRFSQTAETKLTMETVRRVSNAGHL